MNTIDAMCPKCGAAPGTRCRRWTRLDPRTFRSAPDDAAHLVRAEAAGNASIINKSSPNGRRR